MIPPTDADNVHAAAQSLRVLMIFAGTAFWSSPHGHLVPPGQASPTVLRRCLPCLVRRHSLSGSQAPRTRGHSHDDRVHPTAPAN